MLAPRRLRVRGAPVVSDSELRDAGSSQPRCESERASDRRSPLKCPGVAPGSSQKCGDDTSSEASSNRSSIVHRAIRICRQSKSEPSHAEASSPSSGEDPRGGFREWNGTRAAFCCRIYEPFWLARAPIREELLLNWGGCGAGGIRRDDRRRKTGTGGTGTSGDSCSR